MNLAFGTGKAFTDNVGGDLLPFVIRTTTTIVGVDELNKGYKDKCADTESISGTTTRSGSFDRRGGNLDDLQLTITVKHALSFSTTISSPAGFLGCPGTKIPDDVLSVSLTTKGRGSPVDSTGRIVLIGSGTITAGDSMGANVTVSIDGVLSPLPDRALPSPNCVDVPDVTDGVPANVTKNLVAKGFKVITVARPGAKGPNLYVYRQSPNAGSCVAPGSTVQIYIENGPVR
jgi:hypothetical protein